MERVCIIGGGASALMCACFAEDARVVIVDSEEKFGKKILATGNGRCNLTNTKIDNMINSDSLLKAYNFDISKFLKKFNVQDTIKFFNSIGLEIVEKQDGLVYPFSLCADSVRMALINYLNKKDNIKFVSDCKVDGFEISGGKFYVELNGKKESFDKLVVATGNKTDLAYLKNLGISCTSFSPSLCALKTEKHKRIDGVRVSNVNVTCSKFGFSESGEILFKDDGISGIVIFNLSAFMARAKDYNAEITLDFMQDYTLEQFEGFLLEKQKLLKNYTILDVLIGFLHKMLAKEIIFRLKLDEDMPIANLSKQEILALAKEIKCFKLKTFKPCENNQVMSGGVNLDSLDENLQTKIPGLYVIGEAVNVDGVCGGYNLQWAWTSGKIVGENL